MSPKWTEGNFLPALTVIAVCRKYTPAVTAAAVSAMIKSGHKLIERQLDIAPPYGDPQNTDEID